MYSTIFAYESLCHCYLLCLISATKCKEKWRNLRTVYLRKMKQKNETNRKAYYLENAMQFYFPFIKTSTFLSSRNLTPAPLNSTGSDEVVENAETSEDSVSEVDFSQASSSNVLALSSFQHSIPQQSQGKKKLTVENKSAADADQCVAEYFKAKKSRMQANEIESSSQKIDKQQGLKMFLLSLLPELEELSDFQIKLFKRRVFCIIDEIST